MTLKIVKQKKTNKCDCLGIPTFLSYDTVNCIPEIPWKNEMDSLLIHFHSWKEVPSNCIIQSQGITEKIR